MNKKLFSWKALAGLALLVAMGLTSCKQGTEVDPENPTPTKPVTPTASGTELQNCTTIAEVNKLIAETKDITDNIKAGGKVTITIDASTIKVAAGDKLVLPSKTDATINVVFTGAFKENKGLVISDDALDVVNITFPSASMGDVTFEMPYSTLTIASEGATTLGNVVVKTNKNSQIELATTIKDGITIGTFKNWDDTQLYDPIVIDGAEIEALYVDADLVSGTNFWWWNGNDADGYYVPGATTAIEDGDGISVKDLYIADDATIQANPYKKKAVANKITVAEGKTVTLDGAYVKEVVGEGKGATVDFLWVGDLNNDAVKYTNVTIDGEGNGFGGSNNPIDATFKNCTLVDFASLYLSQESATGLVFKFDDDATYTSVYYPVYAGASDASYSYTFTKCEFPESFSVRAFSEGVNILDKNGDPIKQTLYHYEWDDPDDDPDQGWIVKNGIEKLSDIPEAVRKGEIGWYYDYLYEPRTYDFTDLALIPAFSECKYNGTAVSEKNVGNFLSYTTLWGADDTAVATTTQVKIGDKTYKRVYSKNNGWILVEQ